MLNRLARDGVRVRSYALTPGAVVPCVVWNEDQVMVLRLRGDFRGADAVTLSQRVAGAEVSRATCELPAGSHADITGEVIVVTPAALVRQLPTAEVTLLLTANEAEGERPIGTYTLVHEGSLNR